MPVKLPSSVKLAIIFILLAVISNPLQGSYSTNQEQTSFSVEGTVSHPVTVSSEVLKVLNVDDRVRECLHEKNIGQAPASWFVAAEVHLQNARQTDYVVLPVDYCLFGANIAPTWVFAKSPKGYALVFREDLVGIEILKSRTSGYRDILWIANPSSSSTQVVTFKFDGKKYQADPRTERTTSH
jgi:hypothetical protein